MINPASKTIDITLADEIATRRGAPERLIQLLRASGFHFDSEQGVKLEAVRRALSASQGVTLHGRVGVGKSLIGAWLVRQCAMHRRMGRMYTVAGLMQSQKRWFNDGSVGNPSPIDNATSAYLLVIDELIAGQGSLFDHTQITEIIKARYDAQRPTLILTNIRGDKLPEALPAAIYDRLRDGVILELNGSSKRGNQQ